MGSGKYTVEVEYPFPTGRVNTHHMETLIDTKEEYDTEEEAEAVAALLSQKWERTLFEVWHNRRRLMAYRGGALA